MPSGWPSSSTASWPTCRASGAIAARAETPAAGDRGGRPLPGKTMFCCSMLLCQDVRTSEREIIATPGSGGGSRFRVDDGLELTQPIHVLVRVMLAEEQLSTGRQNCAHTGGSPATVATIDRGQWGASQGSWHDSSVLAPGTTVRSPGVGLVVTHHELATATSQQWYDYSVRRLRRGLCSRRDFSVFSLTRPGLSPRANTLGP